MTTKPKLLLEKAMLSFRWRARAFRRLNCCTQNQLHLAAVMSKAGPYGRPDAVLGNEPQSLLLLSRQLQTPLCKHHQSGAAWAMARKTHPRTFQPRPPTLQLPSIPVLEQHPAEDLLLQSWPESVAGRVLFFQAHNLFSQWHWESAQNMAGLDLSKW